MSTCAPPLRRAQYATVLAFALAGVAMSTWVSRVPTIRAELALDPRALGLVLLGGAAGSTVALPFAGVVLSRIGTGPTVRAAGLLASLGLASIGPLLGRGPVAVALALFVVGVGVGLWDVAMNVQGARVETLRAKALMPRLHAAFSLGTVAGALLGTAAIAAGVGVGPHVLVVGLATGASVLWAGGAFLPDEPVRPAEGGGGLLRAWTEPRTLLVGLFVLCLAFAEGTGNDWVAVATIDGYGVSETRGTFSYAIFVAAMTAGRLLGTPLLDRFPRVGLLRATAVLALAGVLLLAFAPGYPLALVGTVAWGLGASLGFPVGMTAAAEDATRAAARVSVVSTIGYLAFLGGPPLLGLLGQQVGTHRAISVVAGLMVVALLSAGSLSPTPRVRRG